MTVRRPAAVAILAAAALLVTSAAPSQAAAPRPRAYPTCTALNQVYPHGVGRAGARDKTSTGRPVTTFAVSSTAYALNDGRVQPSQYDLDRDNDGVACEKR